MRSEKDVATKLLREPHTPGAVLGAMVKWRGTGLPTDSRVTLEAHIERRFRNSFGTALYAVRADQLESAIEHLCLILANEERSPPNTATMRLHAVIGRLVATVGHGVTSFGYADYAALTSAFELARIETGR